MKRVMAPVYILRNLVYATQLKFYTLGVIV